MPSPWDVPPESLNLPSQVELMTLGLGEPTPPSLPSRGTVDSSSTGAVDGVRIIDAWHPRITAYRVLVTALTVGLGTTKAVASTSDAGSATSVTVEWITGIVVLLLTFFLTRYETNEDAKPQWLFKFDIVDSFRALGFPIPMYGTEERPTDLLLKPRQPSVTGYRILVSASAVSFGMTKAFLSYRGLDTAPTTVEWVYGVLITVSLYWLGMYEAGSREVMPWLFVTDYSKQVYSSIFAFGFISVHLAALYAVHWWTRIWYLGVKDVVTGDWTTDPSTPGFDKFFNNMFMLLWLTMAIVMGIGSGVVGTCVILGSLCRLLVPWIFQLVRACLRLVSRRRSSQGTDGWGDDEATLVDFGEFGRTSRWLRNISWPSIQFNPAQNEVWRKTFTALSCIAIAVVYTLAHAVAFIVAFGWTCLWFYGLKALWTQGGNEGFFFWTFTLVWSGGACAAIVVGSTGTIGVVLSFFSPAYRRRFLLSNF